MIFSLGWSNARVQQYRLERARARELTYGVCLASAFTHSDVQSVLFASWSLSLLPLYMLLLLCCSRSKPHYNTPAQMQSTNKSPNDWESLVCIDACRPSMIQIRLCSIEKCVCIILTVTTTDTYVVFFSISLHSCKLTPAQEKKNWTVYTRKCCVIVRVLVCRTFNKWSNESEANEENRQKKIIQKISMHHNRRFVCLTTSSQSFLCINRLDLFARCRRSIIQKNRQTVIYQWNKNSPRLSCTVDVRVNAYIPRTCCESASNTKSVSDQKEAQCTSQIWHVMYAFLFYNRDLFQFWTLNIAILLIFFFFFFAKWQTHDVTIFSIRPI